jgi:hypothetical protein
MQCVFLFYEVPELKFVTRTTTNPRRLPMIIKRNKTIKEGLINRYAASLPLQSNASQYHTKEKLLSRFPGCSYTDEIEREDSLSFLHHQPAFPCHGIRSPGAVA